MCGPLGVALGVGPNSYDRKSASCDRAHSHRGMLGMHRGDKAQQGVCVVSRVCPLHNGLPFFVAGETTA